MRLTFDRAALGAMSATRSNMPPAPIDGELRTVADRHELRPRTLDFACEPTEAVGVGHARLIEEDRRRRVEREPAVLGPGDERVERQRPAGERGTVLAESLRGRTGHRDPERRVPARLLGAGSGVDHHSLAGARRPDQDRHALGPGDDLERTELLVAEARAEPLGQLVPRGRARPIPHVPAVRLCQPRDRALDRLLLPSDGESRHPPTLEREHPTLGDHLLCPRERVGRRELAGRLLEHHGAQLARLERGGALGQTFFDAILELARAARGDVRRATGTLAPSTEAGGRLTPHALQVGTGDGKLGPAVLELQPAQLARLRRSPPFRAEALGRGGDFAAARRERLDQLTRDTGDLEIAAVVALADVDRVAAPRELVRESGAIEGAKLSRGAEDRPGGDGDDLTVIAHGARDHDVAVQLRVRCVAVDHTTRGRVQVLRGDQLARGLLDDPCAVATADRRHRLAHVAHRLAYRACVRLLDVDAPGLIAERPHHRDRLRRAERHVDPAASTPVGAGASEPATTRVPSLHQGDEVRAVDGGALDAEARERLRRGEPATGCLHQLAAWRQVVVAALGRERLALQVAGVAAALRRADARCSHHSK